MEQVNQESQYDWLMFIITQYPYNVHRIDEYCNKVYRGFQRIDELIFATCFNAWCKTVLKVYDIDNGSEILNYDAMTSVLNAVGKIMRLPHAIQLHQISYYVNSFQYNFDRYCDKKKNRLLVDEIMNEIKVVGQEYRLAKENFISSIKEELIKKAWHPNRVMHLMNQGIHPDDM